MKRFCIVCLTVFLLLLVSLACAESQEESQRVFTLPSSLQVIDDEAFSGTAVETVVFQQDVEYIGERAFADIPTLTDIYIPKKTVFIAENAFSCTDVTIHGIAGSYADQWAEKHGFRFVDEDIWIQTGRTYNHLKARSVSPFVIAVGLLSLLSVCLSNGLYTRNRKRVKDYPEMYAIDLVFP